MDKARSKSKNSDNKQNSAALYTLVVFIGTFFTACLMTLVSTLVLEEMETFMVGFVILLVVILVGVVFDIVGTAVSACGQQHLNSKASRRIPGAKKALTLAKNASRVANICNDVVGDICGIVSGATGAVIVAQLQRSLSWESVLVSVAVTALISGLTIGGKAMAKPFAMKQSTRVVYWAGRFLHLFHR